MQKLKKKDFNFKPSKCPYLFLDKNDIHHHELWNYFINDLN